MTARASKLTKRASDSERRHAPVSTIPAPTLRVFVDGLARLGYSVDSLLAAAGLRRSDLEDPDGRAGCEALPAILGAAMQERPMRNLGARLAAETPIGAFRLVDYLAVASPTVSGALCQLARYLRLTEAPYTLLLKTNEDPVRVVFDKPPNPFAAEFGVAVMLLHLRRETDGQLRALTASFRHAPDDRGAVEELLACPVAINQSWDGFLMRREALDLPMRRGDPVLLGVLEECAAEIAAKLPGDSGVAHDVARALAGRLPKGDASIGNIARALATSTRSLQRRLAAAGRTFQQLLDDVRRDSAEAYLSDPTLSVGEVAYLLGYSEPGAFHRAFRRWHRVTPQAFRKQRAEAALSGNSLYS